MCDPSVDEPLPLCREDCEILKYDICRKELEAAKSNDLLNVSLNILSTVEINNYT